MAEPTSGASVPALSRRELRERERRTAEPRMREQLTRRGWPARATRPSRALRSAAASSASAASSSMSSTGRRRGVGRRLLSAGAMLFAGALAIGMSIPSTAFTPPAAVADAPAVATAAKEASVQTLAVPETAAAVSLSADTWTAVQWVEKPVIVKAYGTRNYTYAGGSMGSVRWPFPTTVTISDGFGERGAPCRGCSSFHGGTDFLGGEGNPAFAIADGTVTAVGGDGSLGYVVTIAHVVNGQAVTSTYGHMQSGSSNLTVGQSVAVGQFVGLVGRTGAATGPHLHLEITVDGSRVDPFVWLQTNVN